MKQEFVCKNCNKAFKRYISAIRNLERVFCSRSCASSGSHNPSFGSTWSLEKRERQSKIIKSKVDEAYRWKTGSANRGKKFSPERIQKMHGHRTFESYSRTQTDEARKKIGKASKDKFTPEYKEKIRQHFEKTGYWIPLIQISEIKLYFKYANWIDKMYDFVSDPNQLFLLKEHKVFNCRTNKKGVVRDHMFSRRSGYHLKVFPQILRHPANLQILTHSNNIKKRKDQYVDLDIINLTELFERIKTYEKEWKEQLLCIQLIERYENGERWTKEEGG